MPLPAGHLPASLRPRYGLAEGALLIVVAAWAANFSLVKFAVDFGNPYGFSLVRVAAALLVLLPAWALTSRERKLEWKDAPAFLVLGVTGHAGFQVGYILGTDASSATSATLILSLTPAAIAGIAWTTHAEPFSRATAAGLLISLVGIALVSGTETHFTAHLGNLGLFGAMFGWAVYTVRSTPLVRKYGPVRVTLVSLSIGIVLLSLPAGLFLGPQDFGSLPGAWWVAAAVSGAGAITLAHILWGYATARLGPTFTGVCSNLVPIPALLISYIWLGEELDAARIAGGLLIVGGVAVARIREFRGGKVRRRAPA